MSTRHSADALRPAGAPVTGQGLMLTRRTAVRGGLAAAAAAATAALASACSDPRTASSSSSSDGSTISMGYVPWIGYGSWFIAEDQGYFKDAGVTVNMTVFNSDADKNAAFMSGKIDALNVAAHGALQLIEQGADLKIVLLEDVSTTADAILADGGVTSVSDLKGKQVAYEEITTSAILLSYALSQNDMTMDDIEPVPMKASEAGSALIGGRVDAAVTYEPYVSEATSQDSGISAVATAGEQPGLISDVLIVQASFVEQHPDTIEALVQAWQKGIDYYNSSTDEARTIIAEGVGSDPDSLTTAFDGVEFYDVSQNADALDGTFLTETLPMIAAAAKEAGMLTSEVDAKSAIDASFVKEASS